MDNYYKILEVDQDASSKEINEAILNKLRLWNHRINAPTRERRQEAERMVDMLEEIKVILLDDEKRKQYDEKLKKASKVEVISKEEIEKKKNIETPSPESKQSSQSPNELDQTEKTVEIEVKDEIRAEMHEKRQPLNEFKTQNETSSPFNQVLEEKPTESEQLNEKKKGKKGRVLAWSSLFILIASIGIYFGIQGWNKPAPSTPLTLNQPVIIDDKFMVTLTGLKKQGSNTVMTLSMRPTSEQKVNYENTIKNKEHLQNRPLLKISFYLEDESGNRLIQEEVNTSQARRLTKELSDDMEETYEWTFAGLPEGRNMLMVNSITGLEVRQQTQDSQTGQQIISAEEKSYHYKLRFELPTS
ncbi:DnaJ domain-containing protein [Thermoflavimicrobium daqui]|nr:DnaJ domain-containing protein [Thermoflavimicrobium daqui]